MLCKVKGNGRCGWVGYCCRGVEKNLGMAGTPLLSISMERSFDEAGFCYGHISLHLQAHFLTCS